MLPEGPKVPPHSQLRKTGPTSHFCLGPALAPPPGVGLQEICQAEFLPLRSCFPTTHPPGTFGHFWTLTWELVGLASDSS